MRLGKVTGEVERRRPRGQLYVICEDKNPEDLASQLCVRARTHRHRHTHSLTLCGSKAGHKGRLAPADHTFQLFIMSFSIQAFNSGMVEVGGTGHS